MKKHSIRLLLSVLFLCVIFVPLSVCTDSAPKKTVKKELNLIQNLDENTIKSFISYEDMVHTHSSSEEISPEAAKTIKLFFKNFTYKIKSTKIDGDHATVAVEIKNLDTNALAKDLCKALIAQSASLENESQEISGLTPYFTLLHDFLSRNSYDLITTTAEISLTRNDDVWSIDNSPELEDALVSGFVSHLKDPFLITPEEVLSIYMDSFKKLDAKGWVQYLGMEDIFATGNAIYPDIDLALASQIEKYFDYQIHSSTQNDNSATVNVDITSLDLESVLHTYRNLLMKYANTTAAIRATDSELSDKTSSYLLEALKDNKQTLTKNIELKLVNDGSSWVLQLNDGFSDTLLGDISSAVSAFSQPESEENS